MILAVVAPWIAPSVGVLLNGWYLPLMPGMIAWHRMRAPSVAELPDARGAR